MYVCACILSAKNRQKPISIPKHSIQCGFSRVLYRRVKRAKWQPSGSQSRQKHKQTNLHRDHKQNNQCMYVHAYCQLRTDKNQSPYQNIVFNVGSHECCTVESSGPSGSPPGHSQDKNTNKPISIGTTSRIINVCMCMHIVS